MGERDSNAGLDAMLMEAIGKNNRKLVRELLARGASADAREGKKSAWQLAGRSHDEIKIALIEAGCSDEGLVRETVWAVTTGRNDILRTLIARGADMDMKAVMGTPLSAAAGLGNREALELLIDAGADIDAEEPLVRALDHGHPECALLLIAKGADVQRADALRKTPPLALAALKGYAGVVEAILKRSADPDALIPSMVLGTGEDLVPITAARATALIVAARLGHAAVVEVLLKRGANPHMKDGEGLAALDWAKRQNHHEIVELLGRCGVTTTPASREEELLDAAARGSAEEIRSLVRMGVSIDTRDERTATRGWTPLMHAAFHGHHAAVSALLEGGARANARDSSTDNSKAIRMVMSMGGSRENLHEMSLEPGLTPLICAVMGKSAPVVQLLVKAGADLAMKDYLGDGPVHHALAGGSTDILRLLVEHGADPDLAGHEKNTPLIIAAEKGLIDAAALLIERGAKLEARNSDGETALMKAAMAGNIALVRLLLEKKAKARGGTRKGGSALNAALRGTEKVPLDPKLKREGRKPIATYYEKEGAFVLLPLPEERVRPVVEALLEAGAEPDFASDHGTPLVEAVRSGYGGIVRLLIEAGADTKARCFDGSSLIDMARLYGHQDVEKVLMSMGAVHGEETKAVKAAAIPAVTRPPAMPVLPDFAARAKAPGFLEALESLALLTGSPPHPMKGLEGGFTFHVHTAKRKDVSTASLQKKYLPAGFFVFEPRYSHSGEPEELAILPTGDRYDVIAAMGTNGANYGLYTEEILVKMKELEKKQPHLLTCISGDTLAGSFTSPVKSSASLARWMYEFCPDIVDQGCGTTAILAQVLREKGTLYFWWD